jgi:hypothetical protein
VLVTLNGHPVVNRLPSLATSLQKRLTRRLSTNDGIAVRTLRLAGKLHSMSDTSLESAFRRICATEAPLQERLADFSAAVRQFSLPFANAYDDLVTRIRSGDAGSAAPKPGEPMPPFVLPGAGNRLISLAELFGQGPVVVSFNRGHWCEYCLIELTAFRIRARTRSRHLGGR